MNAPMPCFAPSQLKMLHALSQGPLTIEQLTERMGVKGSTAQNVFARLRVRGLARREGLKIHITDSGRTTLIGGWVTKVDRDRLHFKFSKQQEERRKRLFDFAMNYADSRNLTQREREHVLMLTFPDGMTEAEIARALGVTRQAVNQSLLRALSKLKRDRIMRELGRD